MAYCRAVIQIVSVSVMPGMPLSERLQVSGMVSRGEGGFDLPSWSTFSMQISEPTRMLWGPLTKPPGRSKRVGRQRGECHVLAEEELHPQGHHRRLLCFSFPVAQSRLSSSSLSNGHRKLRYKNHHLRRGVIGVHRGRDPRRADGTLSRKARNGGPAPGLRAGREGIMASMDEGSRGPGTWSPQVQKIRALAPQYLILPFRCAICLKPRYPVIAAWGISPPQDHSSGSQRGPGPRRGPCPQGPCSPVLPPPALGDPSAVSCQCQCQTSAAQQERRVSDSTLTRVLPFFSSRTLQLSIRTETPNQKSPSRRCLARSKKRD